HHDPPHHCTLFPYTTLFRSPSERAAELMAGALAQLGIERGFVVHGSDGLDEITITGPTLAFEVHGGTVVRRTLTPGDFGVAIAQDRKSTRLNSSHQIISYAV